MYESYSIRQDFTHFRNDIQECLNLVEKLNKKLNLETIIELQKTLQFLIGMCRRQSLNQIVKTNPVMHLNAGLNSTVSIKSELLEGERTEYTNSSLVNLKASLEKLIDQVAIKCNMSAYMPISEITEDSKEIAKDSYTKQTEVDLFEKIRGIAEKEKLRVHQAIEEHKTFVKGSISIQSYFRHNEIKNLETSLITFPGVHFTHTRKESITPIHIFHNQTLAILRLKAPKLKRFGAKPVEIDGRALFCELKEKAEKKTKKINLTNRLQTPYLMSPIFKDVRFLWFISPENAETFKNIKDGTINLIWNAHG